MSRRMVPILLVLALCGGPTTRTLAQDPIVIEAQAGVVAPVEAGRVDHSAYDRLLHLYVDQEGFVDYVTWKVKDRPALERYLEAMAAVRPDALADDHERLAYWINVYNALTLHGMLRFYPTKSIKEHVSRLWGFNFWKDVRIVVAGKERSLDAIEHEILRKQGEPRIHFAIVCASKGCPRLRNEAYVGVRLDPEPVSHAGAEDAQVGSREPPGQLDDQARSFFADPKKFRIDRGDKTVWLSSILDWFASDFGADERARLQFVARYVPTPEDREFLLRLDLDVEYLDYDWGINERSSR